MARTELFKVGTLVRRVEGEGEQVADIGRVGKVEPPSGYNMVGGTMTVKYEATSDKPEKKDEHCSPFEFRKATPAAFEH